jgi:uncharacterized membrane protein (UPF0182 family)
MAEDLDKALEGLLGTEVAIQEPAVLAPSETADIQDLGILALQHYNEAKENLRRGDWTEYGKALERMEKILIELSGKGKEKQ